jgi:hypothetical protein
MSDVERKAFAAKLKKAGYNIKVSGAKANTIAIADALLSAQQQQLEYETRLGKKYASIDEFLTEKATGVEPTGGPAAPKPYGTISNKYDAKVYINNVFSGLLNREATNSEASAITKILNDAEKKNLKINKDGITTGGINPQQFIENIIKKGVYLNSKKQPVAPNILSKLSEELKTKKQDVRALYGQDLITTAKANGLTLSESQLDAYTKAIENGTKIDIIKNQIRASAAMGLPDNVKKMMANGTDLETIYNPYKQTMASILELNPSSIDLNDSTLRTAIGANGEMPLYDFEKTLKKDTRWQYTNNAKKEVSDNVLQILQDFGFQG